jgi:hypothetical protein
MRKSFISLVLLAFCATLVAQQALNNASVIKLAKAGLSDDLIVSTINASPGTYDTSADGLIALKTAGASDRVVTAIVAKASAPPSAAGPLAAAPMLASAPANPDDPAAPHDPGVYLMVQTREGKGKMVLIERAGSGREKTANIWGSAFTYGISKAKMKAEIPGPRAAVRTDEKAPTFYMYFPPTGNLGAADTIGSPTQFSLLSLEDKKDHRETTVAKMGLGSASVGNDDKRTIKFHAEKIRPYAYKVTPEASLKAGEYAFIASTGSAGAASAGGVVVFDFGID